MISVDLEQVVREPGALPQFPHCPSYPLPSPPSGQGPPPSHTLRLFHRAQHSLLVLLCKPCFHTDWCPRLQGEGAFQKLSSQKKFSRVETFSPRVPRQPYPLPT